MFSRVLALAVRKVVRLFVMNSGIKILVTHRMSNYGTLIKHMHKLDEWIHAKSNISNYFKWIVKWTELTFS